MATTFEHALSTEGTKLERSVLRELLRFTVDPEIISLAGGLPASERLPLEGLRTCLNAVLTRDGSRALQYSPQHVPLRARIAELMESRGVACTPEQVFITNGNQQGLTILSRLFLDPGAPAVIEEVTFTGIQQVTLGRGAEVRTVPTDLVTGVDVDAVEEAFRREPRPRLLVLVTDFHNPLGVSIAAESRERLARLAAEHRVPLVEDDPYGPLRFAGDPRPPIKAYDDEGMVFYLGSFSKMLAPGLRLGWMVAPEELMPRITTLRESIDLESSTLVQRAVAEFLGQGRLEGHLAALRETHGARCATMLRSLEEHLTGGAQWSRPEGGVFVWVELRPGLDATELFRSAIAKKVAYVPGGFFSVHGATRNAMRLNFSNVTPEAIREGVARVAEVVREG
ncbi:MAG: PLP-dependent aminotransferase family protein [Gemmatimonadetes bacterium]|nr:PLP-dependent aminotransferase family protein [Gemmatimonadota bacterium]